MVRNKRRLILLLIPDFLIFAFGFFIGFDLYLYRRFNIEKHSVAAFLFLIAIIAAFNLIYISSVFILKKIPRLIKCVSLIIIFVMLLWCALVLVGIYVSGTFWKSETDNFSEFSRADPSLNDRLDFLGGNIDEINSLEIQSVENFYYSYQVVLLVDTFEFRGNFVFSEESYNILKNKFIQAPEFDIKLYLPSESVASSMTGCFEWNNDVPSYECTTDVSSWDKMIVEFCDDDKSFHFDLIGKCYT